MNTFIATRTLVSEICCHVGCGILFGVDNEYSDRLRRTHAWFYCPNGHPQHYTSKSDLEIARQETADARWYRDKERERAERLAADLLSEKHKVAAERGAKTKLKRRIANGVCPCCKRMFANVAAHMLTKHPEQVKA
jgi:hypothetical protein